MLCSSLELTKALGLQATPNPVPWPASGGTMLLAMVHVVSRGPPEAMLMSVVIVAAAEHLVEVYDPCCGWKPCWCPWSVLTLEITLI